MKRFLWLVLVHCFGYQLQAQQVNYLEYYLDNDPGYGQGTSVSITTGTDLTADFNVPMDAVSAGPHTLYVRGKDEDGRWTFDYHRTFLRIVEEELPDLDYLEY